MLIRPLLREVQAASLLIQFLVLSWPYTDVDRSSPSNWLDDAFWIKAAYHSWRVPLPVNSNWWILFADDQGIPEQVRSSVPPKGQFHAPSPSAAGY